MVMVLLPWSMAVHGISPSLSYASTKNKEKEEKKHQRVKLQQRRGLIAVNGGARVAYEDKWLLIEKEEMLLLSGGSRDLLWLLKPFTELPAGFRFHPTDEELGMHYLCRKCASLPISVPIIADIDLYKFDSWLLSDKKYPKGLGIGKLPGRINQLGSQNQLGSKKLWCFLRGKRPEVELQQEGSSGLVNKNSLECLLFGPLDKALLSATTVCSDTKNRLSIWRVVREHEQFSRAIITAATLSELSVVLKYLFIVVHLQIRLCAGVLSILLQLSEVQIQEHDE
ncbi:hypothetical protein C5167_032900 [Papaver somniferum]|uniref:NAC domain-containing protein n=1 Tax=Papaver somniferum TaxID=3469 RepID=A0A4Y7KCR8_PAPSO|nr:hypothetical protein C5167_032900 [Papaver somniferum]